MSTAADHDSYDDHDSCDDEDWFEVDDDVIVGGSQGPGRYAEYYVCCHDRDCCCGNDDLVDQPTRGVHPADAKLLDGPAADAMFGLERIRDVPAAQVPPAVMVQAVLGAQRLASYAKAQAMYWTAALARPDVAVPVSDVLDSLAHRNDEGQGGGIPDDLADRAAAGTEVIGDDMWDALLAAEAASAAEPELSAAWLVAPITARRRIADAQELVDELPDTFRALEEGRIEEVRARIIAETTAVLDPGLRRRAEQLILDRAKRGMCPGDLRRLATKVVADIDPDAANRRAEQARARRGTGVRNLGDDLGRFTADLAVEDAALTQAVLDLLAKAIPPEARHGRGLSQLRADIFADLFGELADTGLIDLRGIHPHTDTTDADTASPADPRGADTDASDAAVPDADMPDEADTDNTGSDPAQPGDTDTDPAGTDRPDRDPADRAPADRDAADRAPADGDAADRAPADADVDQEAAADTAEPSPADLSDPNEPSEPTGAEPAPPATPDAETPTTPPDPGDAEDPQPDATAEPEGTEGEPAEGGPGDPDPAADAPGPTAAELLARLRSIDWESRLDPDCDRRGGLLSMIRLPAGVRVNLDVTVALSTLAGYDDLSARLAGLGVITADTARALAKAAGTVRILLTNDPPRPPGNPPPHGSPPANGSPPGRSTDGGTNPGPDNPAPDSPAPARRNNGGIHHDSPDCGTVLDFGRAVYRPPATVIDRVDTRDQRCRFPGCPRIAERCDHDHRIAWDDGGATCPCDIDALCRFHHRAKTFTAWTAIRDQRTNTLTWTSPLVRVHTDRPAPDLPTGTLLNLADRPNLGDTGPAVAEPGDGDVPIAASDLCGDGSGFEADRDPDDPPF